MKWIKPKPRGEQINISPKETIDATADFNAPTEYLSAWSEGSDIAVAPAVEACAEDARDIKEAMRRLEDRNDPTIPFDDFRKELGM